ncbi:MAG: hypothetical protein RL095_991 [Verrucomicrobiota bacterium]|jgi:hypothetical protein
MKASWAWLALLAVAPPLFSQFGGEGEPGRQRQTLRPPDERPVRLEDGRIRLGKCLYDPQRQEISFPGEMNIAEGTLEVLIATPRGRLHEALLLSEASPYQIQLMLLLAGARNDVKTPDGVQGQLIDIDVEWRGDNGEIHREPVENFLADTRRAMRAPPRLGFRFTGSEVVDGVVQAEGAGNIALLYSRPDSVLNCADRDAGKDVIFEANPRRLKPGIGAGLRIILRMRPLK